MLTLSKVGYISKENNLQKTILKNINLTFREGMLYVITGHNGSGKSTLAKIIMGILPPTSGRIELNDKDITHLSIQERVKLGISFAFQQPVRFKGLTVKNLLDTASNQSHNVNDLCSYLSMVGLCAREYINRPLDEKLSGGELKRIEIAMTLAQNKDYVLFDEPEAGIDLWSFDELIHIFETLKQQGKTVIIISHQEKILTMADMIILLSQGKIEKVGQREDMFTILSSSPKCARLTKGGTHGQN